MVGGDVRAPNLRLWGRRASSSLVALATRRWPLLLAAGLILGAGVGTGSLALQAHFQALYENGGHLAGWEEFLRLGAPWEALPPVLAAALLALVGWARLGSSAPEPSYSVDPERTPSASQLRGMLRRERQVVRALAEGAYVLVGVELVRLVLYLALALAGDHLARSTLPALLVQATAWVICGGAVFGWHHRYRERLESWGV